MNIADGFNLWIGKILADLFVAFLFLAIPAAIIITAWVGSKVARVFRRSK